MLIYDSPAYWKRQTRAEALDEVRERNDRALARHRLPDQAHLGDRRRRQGRMLHSADVLREIRRLARGVVLRDGAPGNIALYLVRRDGLRYAGYCPTGWLPEYSVVRADARGLPEAEERGWRTVVSRLIGAGAIGERDVARVFGEPADVTASVRFRRNLFEARNGIRDE